MCQYVMFKTIYEEDNDSGYLLEYNGDRYYIVAIHDGSFHNKLYECEREIPRELEQFVDAMIRKDLEGR